MDSIICAAGNASFDTLSQLTDEQIDLGVKSKLMRQVNICRKGIEVLKPNGVIILTGRIMAFQPWPETSNIAMVNAAIDGFVKALALELTEGRKILVVHPPVVKESAEAMGMKSDGLSPASEVARAYIRGLNDEENGAAIFIKN